MPLIIGLQFLAVGIEGIAQMGVHFGIVRVHLHGFDEQLHRLFGVAGFQVDIAEAVDDRTFIGSEANGLVEHCQGFWQVLAAQRPGVADIVEHIGLVGGELEGLL